MLRMSRSSGILPQNDNELFINLDLDQNDKRRPFTQGQISVRVEEVLRKVDVEVTNARVCDITAELTAGFRERSTWICRWVHEKKFATANERLLFRKQCRQSRGPIEVVFRIVSKQETDHRKPRHDQRRLEAFLGEAMKVKGYYTAADVGCCGGGASAAMRKAGLLLRRANDIDKDVFKTYAPNFPDAETLIMPIADAIPTVDRNRQVDAMHMSWSCQPFARCNTTPNAQRDEVNTTLIFATSPLLQQ